MTDFASTPELGDGAAANASADQPTIIQKLGAEALGTFVLVFIGCGSAVASVYVMGDLNVAAIGLSFGVAVLMMAYALGRISGGHFNPAVSVGAAISGRISWLDCGLYAAAQVVGGLIGGVLLMVTALASDFGWEFGDPLGSNGFGDQGGVELFGALLVEIILTFVFLLVILGVTDERNENANFAPLAIGFSLAAIHFVGIPLTGTSVNPARSIAVAFFSGSDAIVQLWLFIIAPLIGAALAGVIYPLIFGHGPNDTNIFASFGSGTTQQPAGFAGGYQQQWAEQPGQPGAFGQPAQPGQPGQYPAPDAGAGQGDFGSPAAAETAYAAPAAPADPQADPGAPAEPAAPVAGAHAAEPAPQAAQEQPIIQDGWQWDPESQQWIPAQQPPTPGGETVVRPPEGQ